MSNGSYWKLPVNSTRANSGQLGDRSATRSARSRGGPGVADEAVRQRTLHDLAGTWQEDATFDDALREQDTIDHDLWR